MSPFSEPEVRVHAIRLDTAAAIPKNFLTLLSGDERARAERFRFEHDRRRFVLSHAVLRILLGRMLARDPAEILFSYGAKGKPALSNNSMADDGSNRSRRLDFNMSHSGNLAVYCLAEACEIGIDVEEVRPLPDLEDVAKRFFAGAENLDLLSLGYEQRLPAFFRCWTRKEAYIKATGDGLSAPLDQFRVSLLPGEAARILDIRGSAEEAQRWCLHELAWASGYVSAVAYAGRARPLVIEPLREIEEYMRFIS